MDQSATQTSSIFRPPRVLIDTGHLVEIARMLHGQPVRLPGGWQDAYSTILEFMRNGEVVPLFYEPLAYEWIQGTSESRQRELASVLDEAVAVMTVASDHVILRLEATMEAARVAPALGFQSHSPIRRFGTDPALARWKRSMYPEDASKLIRAPVYATAAGKLTVQSVVRGIAAAVQNGLDAWNEAKSGHEEAVRTTRTTQARYGRPGLPPAHWKRHWLKTALGLDATITLHAPDQNADEIIESMDITRCPAISLKTDVLWQYARRPNEPEENDLIDLATLAPMAYADFTLTEKRLADLVRQSRHPEIAERVHRNPAEFVGALSRCHSG